MVLLKNHVRSIVRWSAPSAVAACAGATVAGLIEGPLSGLGWAPAFATIGFVAVVAIPLLFATGLAIRGVYAAWRPRELVERLTEDGGGAPRLAGWIVTLGLACLVVAGAVYEGAWMIARHSTFHPAVLGIVEPVVVVLATIVVVAASRPAVDAFSRLARRIDGRWRRGAAGRASLVSPRALAIAGVVSTVVVIYLLWRLVVHPRIGAFDTGLIYTPFSAVIATWLAHVGFARVHRRAARWVTGAAVVAFALGAVVFALVIRRTDPGLTISIWGDRPVAGLAVDMLYNIEDVRADLSLAGFRPVDHPGAAHPDIILITIDTVRADHTPPYGGTAQMPVLAGLGERGAVFEWAFSPSNVTRRSIPSMVIGYSPDRIHGRVVGWALRVDPRFVMLAERMRAGGYETAAFVCCKGFWGPDAHTGLERGIEHVEIQHDGKKLGAAAEHWLSAREARSPTKPLFVWVHILEPHNWAIGGTAPASPLLRGRNYNRMLALADAIVGRVLAPFAHRSPERAPITIVTADHGEALGDHGQPFHSTDLYNSQTHVPFVIAGPGIPAARLQQTVSLTDLTPTVIELAGFQPPTNLDGFSLAPQITGARPSPPDTGTAFAIMIKDRSNPGGQAAFVRGRYKLIENENGLELYDVYADPREAHNLAVDRPDLVRELKKLLDGRRAREQISPFEGTE